MGARTCGAAPERRRLNTMTRHLRSTAVALAAAALVLSGCNNDDGTTDDTVTEDTIVEDTTDDEMEEDVEEDVEEDDEG